MRNEYWIHSSKYFILINDSYVTYDAFLGITSIIYDAFLGITSTAIPTTPLIPTSPAIVPPTIAAVYDFSFTVDVTIKSVTNKKVI